QHLVGMQGSERIIAINTDRHAPLVQIADYALIGDYLEIVPKLIKGIETRMRSRIEEIREASDERRL
ncbi:MAG: electron transfer flavoprotein subunit alpha, partial [Dehalococcoidia bacterium]